MGNVFSIFSFIVFAAESILSPLAQQAPATISPTKPDVTFAQVSQKTTSFGDVLGIVSVQVTPVPSPTPIPKTARQKKFVIAALGDSMIDTLGPDLPNLKNILTSVYRRTEFTMLNYGVGGTNIDYGIERLTSDYTYLDRHIPALVSQFPDILIVESFAYNPYSFDEGALDTHWLALAKIIDTMKLYCPQTKILLAATIAPNAVVFGDGGNLRPQDADGKLKKVTTIKKYLESTIRFAQSQNVPLANAFYPSLQEDGNGKLEYINGGDNIHYSDAGREFFSKIIADAIIDNHLLE